MAICALLSSQNGCAGGCHRLGPLRKGGDRKHCCIAARPLSFRPLRQGHTSRSTDDFSRREVEARDVQGGWKWFRNFVQRQNLKIKVLHGEAGSVNVELVKEGMEKIREACKKYPPCRIFSVDETGIMWKLMPRRTNLSIKADRKTARGTKGIKFKDRISAFMCANADGTAKVDMAIIGKFKNPRCFRARGCPLKCFAQANAWSDSTTFGSWWQQVFLPFIRRLTQLPVLLLMDGCSSHDDLVDDRRQVTVMTYPPNCTSVHQPMDMAIIYATKLLYRRELLNIKASTMEVAETLRSQAKDRKVNRGMAGLAEGHQPHVLDAADLLKRGWEQVTEKTIARYMPELNAACTPPRYLACCAMSRARE